MAQSDIDLAVREFVVAGSDVPCLPGDAALPDRYDGLHATALLLGERGLGTASLGTDGSGADASWRDSVLDYSVQFWAATDGGGDAGDTPYDRAVRLSSYAGGVEHVGDGFVLASVGPLERFTEYLPAPSERVSLTLSVAVRRRVAPGHVHAERVGIIGLDAGSAF